MADELANTYVFSIFNSFNKLLFYWIILMTIMAMFCRLRKKLVSQVYGDKFIYFLIIYTIYLHLYCVHTNFRSVDNKF